MNFEKPIVIKLSDLINVLLMGQIIDNNTKLHFNIGKKYRITYTGKFTFRLMKWLEKFGNRIFCYDYIIYKHVNGQKVIVIATY